MTKIFINYRTADGPYGATLLTQEPSRHFGPEMVSRDASSIPPGADFETEIMAAARGSGILLAAVGSNWLTAARECPARQRTELRPPEQHVRPRRAGGPPARTHGEPHPVPRARARLNDQVTVQRDVVVD